MLRVIGCITQEHDLRLVAMALCICVAACFTTLSLLARAQVTATRTSLAWLSVAACVFGAGVWSLHFVAMLAFMPALAIAYDAQTTAWSVVIASGGTMLAFAVWKLPRSRLLGGVLGGSLLGLSVVAMHYTGIAAMRLPGTLSFDRVEVGRSVVVGVLCGVLALVRSNSLTSLRRRAEVAFWLALCICGAHFIGMAALTIDLDHAGARPVAGLGSYSLALTVGSVSLAILLISLAATLMEQHLSQRTVTDLKRLRLLSSLSHEVMMIHRDGVILEMNVAGGRLFGLPADHLIGRDVRAMFAVGDIPRVLKSEPAGPGAAKSKEVTALNAAGVLVPVELTCSGIEYEGRPAVAVVLLDLTDRKRSEQQMRHLAHHDALTDLPNRFLLQERLAYALDVAARGGAGVAVLYLDLDRFKPVNDLLGHAGGDALLIQVSKRLRAELRPTDTLARVGGDEFVVVSDLGAQPAKVAILAGRLVEALARPFDIQGRDVLIGVSIGIALYPADGGSQETLLSSADTALYRSKDERRGTFRFYEASMDEHINERSALEQDLRQAIARDELELHYQPLVSCSTGEVDGFEALLRWRHPQRGLVPPGEFIPLAEETGQIARIGEWALETACRAAAAWAKPYWVAVNVSPVQFRQHDLPDIVAAILERSGLAAGRLEIEVTEGVFIDDSRRAVGILQALHEKQVRIALDDFGTGYSSLSYLTSFAFDKIKIDKSFVRQLGQSEKAAMIVRTIIGLGHNLGLSITAEGVETPQQLALLKSERCDHVQGYLLGRPTRYPSPRDAVPAAASGQTGEQTGAARQDAAPSAVAIMSSRQGKVVPFASRQASSELMGRYERLLRINAPIPAKES